MIGISHNNKAIDYQTGQAESFYGFSNQGNDAEQMPLPCKITWLSRLILLV